MAPETAFGIVLKRQRLASGLSQEQLGLNSNLDRTFISLLERGQRQPSLTSIIMLSKSLNISPAEFLTLTMELINEDKK
ncbi:XRE family transcriptional regulator [Pectobacterium punjabense]|uniref:XRE family transcriptional regulator n=1 Tax=Pectobacterium punjabense TaxID=2108399 RepID=A0ABX6L7F0_9GAMM|nr:helix-turn-helix transcriptional regulator [Pectobacterium punjabense]MBS4429717.1 helix-turn-helix transcriptional regulator [Pectobacterium punjabense]PTA64152.1 XRE family transcriptional regulator [Pectobacterium punjabense]QJA22197.1 XRE family transcriptional regulator [Pectobacterium punjabense]